MPGDLPPSPRLHPPGSSPPPLAPMLPHARSHPFTFSACSLHTPPISLRSCPLPFILHFLVVLFFSSTRTHSHDLTMASTSTNPSTIDPTPPPTPDAPPAKRSYFNVLQTSFTSNFQFDPCRATKKTFSDDECASMGIVSSFKGDPRHDQNRCMMRPKNPVLTTTHTTALSNDPKKLANAKDKVQLYEDSQVQHNVSLAGKVTESNTGAEGGSLQEINPVQEVYVLTETVDGDIQAKTALEGQTTSPEADTLKGTVQAIPTTSDPNAKNEGYDQGTPLFNRFKSLENLGEEDKLPGSRKSPQHLHVMHYIHKN
ncbi:hypothetical protein Salat_1168900 [Sesamum alatum]|uniref:Uncharacterized protein n=1 Tax=Sesamum alatum TaxID=300844 RepID=A0AAE2CNI5_9LAMI|nr:hypothetical protein Salat_1168900 [Sesamum alatum]